MADAGYLRPVGDESGLDWDDWDSGIAAGERGGADGDKGREKEEDVNP